MAASLERIINEKLRRARQEISSVCARSTLSRNPEDITIVAVGKRQPVEALQAAYAVGIRDFGENFVQETASKHEQFEFSASCTWHLVGPLQANKAAQAAVLFSWIHSLDRIKVARRLGNARKSNGQADMQACVQVNLGNEATKSGIGTDELEDFLNEARATPGIKVRGLMCVPEPNLDETGKRNRFAELADMLKQAQDKHPDMDTLSMGMSDDYLTAIEQGATIVRLGTGLFGPRQA